MNTGRPASQPRTPFGKRLQAAREARGLSQAQVATQIGMSQNAYACWERKPVALRPDQIEQLAKILNVPVDTLFNGKGGMNRKADLSAKHDASSRKSADCHASGNNGLSVLSKTCWPRKGWPSHNEQ